MIKKGRIDTLFVQEDMIRLRGRVNETRAGATLCQTLQKAFTQEMDDFRKLQELAQEQNNVEVVRLLKVRCKVIEEDLRKVETRKIPLVMQILLFFKTSSAYIKSPRPQPRFFTAAFCFYLFPVDSITFASLIQVLDAVSVSPCTSKVHLCIFVHVFRAS